MIHKLKATISHTTTDAIVANSARMRALINNWQTTTLLMTSAIAPAIIERL